MPYPRKTTEQLRLTGTWRRDRHIHRQDVEGGNELIEPPSGLFEAELEVWHELQHITPPRLLRQADAHLVELYCRGMARYRRAAKELGGGPLLTPEGTITPLVGELRRAERALSELGEKMGLSPSSRTRLLDGSIEPASDFDGLTSAFGELRVIRGNRPDLTSNKHGHRDHRLAGRISLK
jgi:P27 family predicted phage terminase small subunit